MKNSIVVVLTALLSLFLWSFPIAAAQADGRAIEFEIDEKGSTQLQTALVQDQRVYLKQAGGDPNFDVLFDAAMQTLFIIDHQNKSYYKIDQGVINMAASMIESLTNVAESQQGVLSDLLSTLGISGDKEADKIVVVKTEKILSAANIDCRLFQQFKNDQLESELCIAEPNKLTALGAHYATLNAFYLFGDQIVKKAGNILSNMGMVVPKITRPNNEGLPILGFVASEKLKVSLIKINKQESAAEYFQLPQGYTQSPIPFIS